MFILFSLMVKMQDPFTTKALMLNSVCTGVLTVLGIPFPSLVLDVDGHPQP